jgi:hypothetical protein
MPSLNVNRISENEDLDFSAAKIMTGTLSHSMNDFFIVKLNLK